MNNRKSHRLLLICIGVSSALCILFLFLKSRDYLFMDIDVKWLLVSGVPILFALIIDGYIKSLNVLGFEANLNEPIPATLIFKNNVIKYYDNGIIKGSVNSLASLDSEQKNRISRLKFTIGAKNYYVVNDVICYFNLLKNLEVIEIVNKRGQFKFLISTAKFYNSNEINYQFVEEFIRSLENSTITTTYPDAIKDFVFSTDNILEAYKKIIISYSNNSVNSINYYLPVVNKENVMVGVIFKNNLEEKISEEVVKQLSND